MSNHQPDTNEPFSLNLNPDTLPDVSLVHDSTTNEVHIKFFNVDDEVVLDLWGQLNDVGSLISGLSTFAEYYALLVGIDEAVAKHDLAGAIECFNALKNLPLTSEFDPVFENVEVKTNESRSLCCRSPASPFSRARKLRLSLTCSTRSSTESNTRRGGAAITP